jgi:hypothetical protein
MRFIRIVSCPIPPDAACYATTVDREDEGAAPQQKASRGDIREHVTE